ncbi:MAG: ABC transporter permease [Microbacteriaceae bacterium]|nr:ABC transporter permease [Microbacteriaceae bacterium]
MSPRRTFATAGRVLTQIRHDPRTVGLLLIVPSLLIGLLAWIFDGTPVFNQIGPAVLALVPFTIMFVVTSMTTLRERRTGTLERQLTLPISKLDIILGYTIAFGILAAFQAGIAVGFSMWVFGLEISGSVWWLLVIAVADAVLGTALGLLASAFANTEFQVAQFMPAFVFPQMFLGGLLLPRDQMPDVLYVISDWLPLSHAIDALNAVAWDTEDAAYLWMKLLIIGAFIVGAIILGSVTLKRRTP